MIGRDAALRPAESRPIRLSPFDLLRSLRVGPFDLLRSLRAGRQYCHAERRTAQYTSHTRCHRVHDADHAPRLFSRQRVAGYWLRATGFGPVPLTLTFAL